MKTTDKDNPYELDVKKMILDNPKLFGNLGKSTVVLEKAIGNLGVIADALVFSSIKGIIGIEIKTEHDSTQRLNKQLNAYEQLSEEVWVVIHESLIDKVEKVLKDNNHSNVGIIVYGVDDGVISAGRLKEPGMSPKFNPRIAVEMLWKSELVIIGNSTTEGKFINQLKLQQRFDEELSTPNYTRKLPYAFRQGKVDGKSIVISKKMTKKAIIDFIIARLTLLGAYQLVVDMFINQTRAPQKVLKYYHFRPYEETEIEVRN